MRDRRTWYFLGEVEAAACAAGNFIIVSWKYEPFLLKTQLSKQVGHDLATDCLKISPATQSVLRAI